MFIMGCQDASQAVAVAALKATGAYTCALANEDEALILRDVIAPMLHVMNLCLQKGDEEIVVEALDVIQECCYSDQPLVNDHIEVRATRIALQCRRSVVLTLIVEKFMCSL